VVEAIEGSQEVLVRGLGRHAALWPGVVGATELWDGSVALVLDLPLLLSLSRSPLSPSV
jgi:chemotaxis protein histidine kinase CheA